MTHHDIKLCNPLIVNSTQGTLNTIEYLLCQIKYFQKKTHLKGSLEKRAHYQQTFRGQTLPLPPCSGGPDTSASSFIKSLKRFISRREIPYFMISDNATCFKNEEVKLSEELT